MPTDLGAADLVLRPVRGGLKIMVISGPACNVIQLPIHRAAGNAHGGGEFGIPRIHGHELGPVRAIRVPAFKLVRFLADGDQIHPPPRDVLCLCQGKAVEDNIAYGVHAACALAPALPPQGAGEDIHLHRLDKSAPCGWVHEGVKRAGAQPDIGQGHNFSSLKVMLKIEIKKAGTGPAQVK